MTTTLKERTGVLLADRADKHMDLARFISEQLRIAQTEVRRDQLTRRQARRDEPISRLFAHD